jgi:hypothetical protein
MRVDDILREHDVDCLFGPHSRLLVVMTCVPPHVDVVGSGLRGLARIDLNPVAAVPVQLVVDDPQIADARTHSDPVHVLISGRADVTVVVNFVCIDRDVADRARGKALDIDAPMVEGAMYVTEAQGCEAGRGEDVELVAPCVSSGRRELEVLEHKIGA